MDKDTYLSSSYNHSISVNERKNLSMTGVKKIESFDEKEFLIDSNMGHILIKGDDMELLKMDSVSGNISIKGFVNSFSYVDDLKKKSDEGSILGRLFK